MAKYRTKDGTVVNAVQFTGGNVYEIPQLYMRGKGFAIRPRSGLVFVEPGDWIITGPGREVMACTTGHFEENYQPVEADEPEAAAGCQREPPTCWGCAGDIGGVLGCQGCHADTCDRLAPMRAALARRDEEEAFPWRSSAIEPKPSADPCPKCGVELRWVTADEGASPKLTGWWCWNPGCDYQVTAEHVKAENRRLRIQSVVLQAERAKLRELTKHDCQRWLQEGNNCAVCHNAMKGLKGEELAAAANQVSAHNIGYRQAVAGLEEALSAARAECEALRDQRNAVGRQLGEARAMNEDLSRQLAEREMRLKSLRRVAGQAAEATKKMARYRRQCAEKGKEIAQLVRVAVSLWHDLEAARATKDGLIVDLVEALKERDKEKP